MIQSLENFVSMAIQGTQVPMYTKHTLFLYFFDFFDFFQIFFEKDQKNKKTVYVLRTLVLVYFRWPLKQSFLSFISFVA